MAPGADPGRIRWRYGGVDAVRVDERSGDLEIGLSRPGRPGLVENAPVAWQMIDGHRVSVMARYTTARDGEVGFALGPYDHGRTLTLLRRHFGNSGRCGGRYHRCRYHCFQQFPAPASAEIHLRNGNSNAFVTQFRPGGQAIFSTYFGSDSDLAGTSGVAADGVGDLYLAGVTRAHDFPSLNPAQPALGGGVSDAFAAKISGPGISVEFSPPGLVFGRQRSGTTSLAQTVLLRSIATTPVSIGSVTLAGPNPLDFTITPNTCAGAVLPPDATCQIAATFSPRASGMRYARIALMSPSWAATRNVPLSGKGAPTVELSPASLDFPITKRFATSQALTETLHNVGVEPLVLSAVTITGTNATEFSFAGDTCANATVAPDGTCDISVRFKPSVDGQRFALLGIASAVFDAPATVPLSGVGGNTPSLTVDGAAGNTDLHQPRPPGNPDGN